MTQCALVGFKQYPSKVKICGRLRFSIGNCFLNQDEFQIAVDVYMSATIELLLDDNAEEHTEQLTKLYYGQGCCHQHLNDYSNAIYNYDKVSKY
jgi:hypothetical protein